MAVSLKSRRIGIIFLFVAGCLQSQNLVPNSGFEIHNSCPLNPGNAAQDLEHWSMPTTGSTDFFHACSTVLGVPENFNGSQWPKEGQGYVGLYAYAPNDYREYLQVRLNKPLEQGLEYTLRYFVSLAERSDFAVPGIDALLTSDPIRVRTKKPMGRKFWSGTPPKPYQYLKTAAAEFYEDTDHWQLIEFKFTARGNEEYLTLGNFQSNAKTRNRPTGILANKGAYYYIDEVVLRPTKSNHELNQIPARSQIELPTIYFEFDSSALRLADTQKLLQIAEIMHSDLRLSIEILGHTDGEGSASYNNRLSQARCMAVVNHFIQLGIASNRIIWQGFGATRPAAGNTTTAGRQQNRRVEFQFHVNNSQ
ncbi:MAG: hypothetical protein RLZZ241_1168 [Bacteroidota bacterium]|jgi:outer membrane protein OmpA-like peptidoglycan-associated protein